MKKTLLKRFLLLFAMLIICRFSVSAQVTIASQQIKNWQGGTSVELRIYALDDFVDATGQPVVKGSPYDQTQGKWFSKVTCTVASTTLTCPSVNVPPTVNSIDKPGAKLGAFLFNPSTNRLIGPYSVFGSFSVPASPSSTTWSDIRSYNIGTIPPATQSAHITGALDVDGNANVDGNLNVGGVITGNASGINNIQNSALPSIIYGKTINNSTFNAPSVANATIGSSAINNPTVSGGSYTGGTFNSPVIVNPSYSGNVAFPGSATFAGNGTFAGTVTANAFVGNAAGLYNYATGVVTPNSLSSTGSVALNAATSNGSGVIGFTVKNVTALEIGNNRNVGIGLPGDYGASTAVQSLLNFRGAGAKGNLIWKAWSSDPNYANNTNFSFYENLGPNVYSTRGMQGYYMGTNASRGGFEFSNEGQFLMGWETYWDGFPGDLTHPAQEYWWYIRGHGGTSASRVLFMYSPLNNPEQTSLAWNLDNMTFSNWAGDAPWLGITPGNFTMSTQNGISPKFTTDSTDALIWSGSQRYPFVNSASETEINPDGSTVRFMSGHDTNFPSADYEFLLGSGSNRPALRFNITQARGWEYSNNGTTYIPFTESMRGVYRKSYILAAAAGSYSTLGDVDSATGILAFTVVINENNMFSQGNARVFQVPMTLYGTQNQWKEVLPLVAASGGSGDTTLKLDIKTDAGTGRTILRVRRGSTISDSTPLYAEIRLYTSANDDFTASTATGTGATVADTLQVITASTKVQTLVVDYGGGVTDSKGTGSPEGVVSASPSSTYRRTDCNTLTNCLYVKTSGTGNTGWTEK
jgi:hypothetical protein